MATFNFDIYRCLRSGYFIKFIQTRWNPSNFNGHLITFDFILNVFSTIHIVFMMIKNNSIKI